MFPLAADGRPRRRAQQERHRTLEQEARARLFNRHPGTPMELLVCLSRQVVGSGGVAKGKTRLKQGLSKPELSTILITFFPLFQFLSPQPCENSKICDGLHRRQRRRSRGADTQHQHQQG